jgi:type II secretory pathway component PulC
MPNKLAHDGRNKTLFFMRTWLPVFAALAVELPACGGASSAPAAPAHMPAASVPQAAVSVAPEHSLSSSAVRNAVAQGLGAFLQHVELDDKPVFIGGKFRGFRIKVLRDAAFWSGVDLKPGDVVTRVNGLPIERPEQALRAFESLESSRELRVSYERGGEPRELLYPIVDDR